jgi:selenocysteine lyase/cysteine desulfurase
MKSGETDGYDAVFLSPHKFVGGPGTPGILVMNKALYRLNARPPSTCGGGTVAYVNGFSEEVRATFVTYNSYLSSTPSNKNKKI